MFARKSTFISAAIFFVIFSLFSSFSISNAQAENLPLGPSWVNGTLVQGQETTIFSRFQAPSNVNTQQYVLDTEIYSAANGARVAQFYETVQLKSQEAVIRSYHWKTAGLATGKYIVKQGLFSTDWRNSFGWNNESGSTYINPVGSAPAPAVAPIATPAPVPTATPAPAPTATPAPATAPVSTQKVGWQTSARLQAGLPVFNTTKRLEGTFNVETTGAYILNMELYDTKNNKVGQYYETRNVTAGANQVVVWNWTANIAGALKVKMGIFTPNWQSKYWNDNALSFTVANSSTVPTPAPVKDPIPSPVPAPAVPPVTSNASYLRGINLAGAEFGHDKLPGVYGIDYIYPSNANLDYYNSKGLKLVRLPFLWERLQRTLGGPLDATELGRIDAVVAAAKARGMQIILDPHNYGRYTLNGTQYLIGTSQVPNSTFTDFWTKLANHYKNESTIYAFSLMNEPHDTNGTWPAAAQAGLNGVRSVDKTHLVMVPGDGWSGAWSWKMNNANLLLNDPSNNLMYEAHQYFDRDNSGTYKESYDASGAYPMVGADRVQPFLDWLKANNVRGIITEYGIPNNDPRWQVVLDNFLNKLNEAGVGGTYWAGGPWWGDYVLSSEPTNGQDKPVMNTLIRHLSK
jgi:endoglucanase